MINSQSLTSQIKHQQLLQNQQFISQCQLFQVQKLNLDFKDKKLTNLNQYYSSISTKVRPTTDRVNKMNGSRTSVQNISRLIKNIGQNVNQKSQKNKTDRQTLLQKKKCYAENIRQKNKLFLQQNTQKGKKKSINQSMNHSTNQLMEFTPPKQINLKNKSKNLENVQSEYFSLKKPIQSCTLGRRSENIQMFNENSTVFKQSNQNRQNILRFQLEDLNSSKKNGVSSKITNIMNRTVDVNQSKNSNKNKKSNKENKSNVLVNTSNNKNGGISKCGSYAQIFDKKSTMQALVSHQKSSLGMSNGVMRRMSSSKKEQSSLRSMFVAEFNEQFDDQGDKAIKKSLDEINSGVKRQENEELVEQFTEIIEQISQIYEIQDEKEQAMSQQYEKKVDKDQEKKMQGCKKRLSLTSNVYSQLISRFDEIQRRKIQEQKEIVVLTKQNSTFKRQLAVFRKENSTLKKELQNCKKHIQELEEKAKKVLEQQEKMNSISLLEMKNKQFIQVQEHTNKTTNFKSQYKLNQVENNLQQILQETQQEIFSLKSQNKGLQLKVYMLEKKMIHEQQLNKKRLAIQINSWKQKYNKLRNEHLRTKNSVINPFLNSDWSISMQISRDE